MVMTDHRIYGAVGSRNTVGPVGSGDTLCQNVSIDRHSASKQTIQRDSTFVRNGQAMLSFLNNVEQTFVFQNALCMEPPNALMHSSGASIIHFQL
ncbi:MAG: hypothetical protein EOP89_09355 [Lysobacteraceae bacterium]|nr:MAG: hypothetical protein EOP89_09355 [Xanthomonadaceae bacterium]